MSAQSRTALVVAAVTGLVIVVTLAADVGVVEFIGAPVGSPGSVLHVEMTGFAPTGRSVGALAPATGTAVFADAAGGAAVFADSQGSYGVWGKSTNSWGGYFTSDNGYGIRVDTNGTDHWDHGAYITAEGGWGVYAVSTSNQAVRGEAGNVTGILQPLGPVGVVGRGSNRGVYGASGSGIGAYGHSDSNYGVWGQSNTFRGVTGRTSRTDNNYGLYTPDNIYSLNYNSPGTFMQVVQNAGTEPLEKGDVVVFTGVKRPGFPDDLRSHDPDDPQARVAAQLEAPIVRVSKATAPGSSAVAGVVYSRFDLAALDESENGEGGRPDDLEATGQPAASLEVTPAGPAERGDYLLVVVQGPAEVKADYVAGDIGPGTVLAVGFEPGRVASAAEVVAADESAPAAGTILGKALEAPPPGSETLYAYVTLQ